MIIFLTFMVFFNFIPFPKLSAQEKEALFQLRHDVFVIEQDCDYVDKDHLDQHAIHCLGQGPENTNFLYAYARILPPENGASCPKIGRVVVPQYHRKTGLGRNLIRACLKFCEKKWPHTSIHISAQIHAQKFYQSLGFVAYGEEYTQDKIPHVKMSFQKGAF